MSSTTARTRKSTAPVSTAVKDEVAALVESLKLAQPQPLAINKQPRTTGSQKLLSAERYEQIMNRQSALGWQVAWVRPGYAMLKTGTKGEWVTVCVHGTVKPVSKGAEAEKAGRARATWCASCASA